MATTAAKSKTASNSPPTEDTMDKHFNTISKALDAILAESAEQTGDDLTATLARVNEVIAQARGIKQAHAKAIRNMQSKASAAKRREKVAAALAMYEEAQKSA
ncbi:hypothetical protein MZK47_07260 [Microbacterium aerolatum]|uniref:hypothetical protein n=1 Tax=Microbacterium aerolatum TaxID=153731 RepID=UPI0020013737|nr:hypothetical protein [Microbacterium aerolatum]MCK3769462.1 hypothetical protein [Microbacterium aerolatum]